MSEKFSGYRRKMCQRWVGWSACVVEEIVELKKKNGKNKAMWVWQSLFPFWNFLCKYHDVYAFQTSNCVCWRASIFEVVRAMDHTTQFCRRERKGERKVRYEWTAFELGNAMNPISGNFRWKFDETFHNCLALTTFFFKLKSLKVSWKHILTAETKFHCSFRSS